MRFCTWSLPRVKIGLVMHTFLFFFFPTKSFGYYNENLTLLQRKPQAERYSKTYEMKSNIVRAGIEKKKFDHVVSTTASVGELFSTECRTNMTLKSKQFQKTENISHASIHQTILLLVCLFSFLRMEKTGKDVTSNTFSHCL